MDTLIEIGKQIPSLTVLTVLVVLFLKHLRDEREDRSEQSKARDESLAQMHRDCHDFQTRINDQASEMIGKAIDQLGRNGRLLDALEKKLDID